MALASPANDCHWLSCPDPRCGSAAKTKKKKKQAQMGIVLLSPKLSKRPVRLGGNRIFKTFFN
jgi:hypothetical protein